MVTKSIYEQLHAFSRPHLTAYETDLEIHDKTHLDENPGTPFLHFTRPTGTDIITLIEIEDYPPAGVYIPFLFGRVNRVELLENSIINMGECHAKSTSNKIALYFNGKTLKKINTTQIKPIIDEYARKIRALFKNR